jgi:predicted ATP-binding protein involved in virulence
VSNVDEAIPRLTNKVFRSENEDDETSEFDILGTEFKELYESDNTLKNLILCLGEQRNNTVSKPKQHLDTKPRTLDLLPLLRGNDQSCLEDWSSWLANLENKKTLSNEIEATINLCFEIFSNFMGEKIKSAGLKKVEPESELWITYSSGKSIPLKLASQGYQSVMGWVGFIIQRMIEANEQYSFPLSQPSIIIIDEIDQLLSIKWQQKILPILMEFFPNTQWIISTHSPMVLTDLEKHQIIQLIEKDGNITAETNEVDLWMWQYSDIIRKYFDITTKEPKYIEKEIKDEIFELSKKETNNEILAKITTLEERLEKVKESIAAVDEFEKQLQSLKNKEKQLIEMMKNFERD